VNAALRELRTLAEEELNCTLAQLALAWVIRFQHTSTALIGARSVKQLKETLGAFSIYQRISPHLEKKINKILSNTP
jgi:aryl-alcohol dehydrogenase-like predicted oxidoreductase